ncbi:hypothetical protein MSAN_01730400 [Mycena sanguinolenta]|uniref:GATA-type domain-containing protein n=1 Tax=Mycena sanguinolenta TaxID=230812 RepID=A0A8H7CT90_9AGAR|nr:hypothetical protein MSAN_01730400 [Mycena sanguinolenta]
MDGGTHALTWSSTHQHQLHPVVGEDSAPPSMHDDTHAPPGVAHSDGGFIQPGQVQDPTQSVLPPGYTTARGYQYSGVGAHNTPFTSIPPLHPNAPTPLPHYAHGHPDVAAAPRDGTRYWPNVTPHDSGSSSNGRLDHQYGGMGGPSALPPFPPVWNYAPVPQDVSTRYSPDELRNRIVARLPSVQSPLNTTSLPPTFNAPTVLLSSPAINVLMGMRHLPESQLREVWYYMNSRTEDDFVASVREPRDRSHSPPSNSIPSHPARSSTRHPIITTVSHGAEMTPPWSQTHVHAMSESPRDLAFPHSRNRGYRSSPHFDDATRESHAASTSSMASTSTLAVSPPSFGDLDCGPPHDPQQQHYMFSHQTHVSPFPQGVFGPFSKSPQNHSTALPSNAPGTLGRRLPSRPSAWRASTSPPASRGSKVRNPKKKPKPGRCANCQTTETTQWRRDPDSEDQLCNPCGQKAYKRDH